MEHISSAMRKCIVMEEHEAFLSCLNANNSCACLHTDKPFQACLGACAPLLASFCLENQEQRQWKPCKNVSLNCVLSDT